MTEQPSQLSAQEPETQYFRTPFVFVDTEAYRRQGFDWDGDALSGLLKLTKKKALILLTTYITKREVRVHLDQWVEEAAASVHKHRRLLRLAGFEAEKVLDAKVLKAKAWSAFDAFLTAAQAVDVPLVVEVQALIDDHFDNRAPFSNKKNSEFKDAMVCAALAAWCRKLGRVAYVVSTDRDLKAYCETTEMLIHVDRIADVLSCVLASDALHNALRVAFSENDDVCQALLEPVMEVRARTPGASRHYSPGPIIASGHVSLAELDEVTDVSALEISGDRFVCEVSFQANVTMKLDVEDIRYHEEGPAFFSVTMEKREPFVAVLTVRYDVKQSKVLEVLEVDADIESIELDEREVKDAIY